MAAENENVNVQSRGRGPREFWSRSCRRERKDDKKRRGAAKLPRCMEAGCAAGRCVERRRKARHPCPSNPSPSRRTFVKFGRRGSVFVHGRFLARVFLFLCLGCAAVPRKNLDAVGKLHRKGK